MKFVRSIKIHWLFTFSALLLSSLLFHSTPVYGTALQCSQLFISPTHIISLAKTRIETEIENKKPKLSADDQLLKEIDDIRIENPELASKVAKARDLKRRGQSLKVDLSHLSTHMIFFLQGSYEKVVGNRGAAKPFVSFRTLDENNLIIEHEGDVFPLLIRWSESVSSPQKPRSIEVGGKAYQMLELPLNMRSKQQLQDLPSSYIYGLIAGSGMNKYISTTSSKIMKLSALLHDEKLVYDRPTQQESKEVTTLLNTNEQLRLKVQSLLFVAPTASGKTKVLGDRIINKLKTAQQLKSDTENKLTLLMTKTPDLTSELAKGIGEQITDELGAKNFRLIQWGGELTENMSLPELLKFIESSPVPVLLVTSYPMIAARVKTSAEKSALFKNANGLMIDEAHNAGGTTFEEIMAVAKEKAALDRQNKNILNSLDIFGVTASPITRVQRTVELFDNAFWAGLDSPKAWAKKIIKGTAFKPSIAVLEWIRVIKQYNIARDRGEISSSDPIFYKAEERGFDFSSIFRRSESGSQSSVNIERLKKIWPDVNRMIENHGPGVIHTYPRDAEIIAKTLSEMTGKNYVSLQKLDQTTRLKVYDAFRTQTLFNGQKIDAIVGTIREGLDFPQAGWYLSFKKYVRFPENVQGPGRVVRLALNKLSPVIIFFGEEANKIAYENVKELIMTRLGRLPGKLQEPRLYTGSRRLVEGQSMSLIIDNLNTSMQALVRIRADIAKQFGDKDHLDEQKISEMQNVLRDIRLSGQNKEIAHALKVFVAELNSYSFYKGSLKSTWDFCDRILSYAKKTDLTKSRLSATDLQILKDPEALENIKHFRSLYAALGVVPRAILATMELRPITTSEIAKATNAFIAREKKAPYDLAADPKSLAELVKLAISTSPEEYFRNLDSTAQLTMKPYLAEENQVSLESTLQSYFAIEKKLPTPSYDLIGDNQITAVDRIGGKLYEELLLKMKEGTLDITQLSSEFKTALDQSELYKNLALETAVAITNIQISVNSNANTYIQGLKDDGILTYENLMHTGDFKILKIIKALSANPENKNSQVYMQMMQENLTIQF